MKSLVSQSQAHRVSNYGLNLIITLSTISCSFSTQIQSTLESASELISGIVLDTGTRFNQLHQQNSLSCSIDVGDASSACRRQGQGYN
ncbi:hypothetical protein HAX54_035388 [Datura stramonium]|uniref:Uncharacterized protein n=1 Tax=Datura stramonium TaxID=4076 RepID=A0ABS8SFL4_DATST|nr:hypothetical protein [Datura stramonium]